jgi:glyoxylate reductase
VRVFVTRTLPGPALERLREEGLEVEVHQGLLLPREELLKKVEGVVGLIPTVEDRIDEEVMERAGPGLKVIACYSVGVDHVDLEAARRRGIRVTHTPGVLTEATADLTLALLLAVARRVVEGVDHAREGLWRAWHPELLLGLDLGGLTLGLVGMGRIGQAVAKRAEAFGMRVVYHSRTEKPLPYPHRPRDELLATADILTRHAPQTPATHRRLLPREEHLKKVEGVVGLIPTVEDRIDEEVMERAGPGLKVIACYSVGVDHVDLEAARRRGIRVTLGIVGMGRIGQAVAKRAQAFGMRVVYTSRTPKPLPYPFLPLEELLAQADIVSLHAPLTPETHRLLNRERLFAMKPGAILLNTARGGLVDTEALVEALDGHLFGAGLDVTDPEPLPPEHPLYARKNAVITPHLGSAGRRTRERMAMMAVENLLAVLKGLEPPNPVA